MREYLVFTLTASLGAMGELAGHERRGTWTWPGRSGIIGLLAAAKGIRRNGDFSSLDGLTLSVAVFDPGEPLRDFHTAQTVPTAAARRPQSRPQAIREAKGKLNTTISKRDYRCTPLYGIAISGGDLEALRDALLRPVFTLYLGRKSCPLSAPLSAQCVSAASAEEALGHLRLPPWRAGSMATQLFTEEGIEGAEVTETRHDLPLDRQKWHFGERHFRSASVMIDPSGRPV